MKKKNSKNDILEMTCSETKMRFKRTPEKVNLVMGKTISKRCTLDCSCKCPCTFPHNYT